MIFSSLEYLLFLPLAVLLFWSSRGNLRTLVVVLTSYYFYMSWMPVYGVLLFLISLFNWLLALGIERFRGKNTSRVLLLSGLIINVGALCYYKYANFFLQNLFELLRFTGGTATTPVLDIILPLGISFFVFEFVHYLVDVYKGSSAARSFLQFAAFAAFFPSQIAGPIKRYQDFMPRLINPEKLTRPLFYEGASLIMQGLFKKVAIADSVAVVIAQPYATLGSLSVPDAWIAVLGFTLQIYCDFSGYTDMGRGSALLMGIRLPINFDLPLLAPDLTQFWRRWHISLSSWLRDYVYIPMGGSRRGTSTSYRNLFLTMTIGGLWHGASWHFVVWGCAHGLGLIVHRLWCSLCGRPALTILQQSKVAGFAGGVVTFLFVALTFGIFRAPDMAHVAVLLSGLFNFHDLQCTLLVPLARAGVVPIASAYLLFYLITSRLLRQDRPVPLEFLRERQGDVVQFKLPLRLGAWTAACVLMVAARPVQAVPFLYFQF